MSARSKPAFGARSQARAWAQAQAQAQAQFQAQAQAQAQALLRPQTASQALPELAPHPAARTLSELAPHPTPQQAPHKPPQQAPHEPPHPATQPMPHQPPHKPHPTPQPQQQQGSCLDKNLAILKAHYPDFYETLMSDEYACPGLRVEDPAGASAASGASANPAAASGASADPAGANLVLSRGDARCALHSVYDPDREMRELFRPLSGDKNQVIVVFGLGLGHCVDYIAKKRIQYKKLVVLEPCSDILLAALARRPAGELLGAKNEYVHLFSVANAAAALLLREAMESRDVKILYHVSYMTIFRDTYDEMLRTFRSEKNSMRSSVATFRHFASEWALHQLKSVGRDYPDAGALAGRFAGVPGIVASAGPSLEKHFGLLREVGDRALIVSPGTSSKILNLQGIEQHISMSIDSQAIQAGIYDGFTLRSALVASHRVHPDVFARFPNAVLRVVLSTEYLARYYYDWAGASATRIDDHASVASSAVDLLVLLGCDPIVFIGQDMAYVGGSLYAAGVSHDAPGAPKRQVEMIDDVDIYGEKVKTGRPYKSMQRDMEALALRYGGKVKMLNATEGGIGIPGVENVRFADVCGRYVFGRPADIRGTLRQAIAEACAQVAGGAGATAQAAGGAGAPAPERDLSGFYSHVLEACAQIEQITEEKSHGYARLAKLKQRGMSRARLDNEMGHIVGHNKRMEEVPFYAKVVRPSIEQQLLFFRAAGKHISDAGEAYEGSEPYERMLDEATLAFTNSLKKMALGEMAAKGSVVEAADAGSAAEAPSAASAGSAAEAPKETEHGCP